MKAVTRSKYGSPDVLSIRDIEKPKPKENEVLIRVIATTVNRTDYGILSANYFMIRFFTGLFKPKHSVTGTDFAGIIEEAGNNVTRFKPGDRVWGFNDTGLKSHAEYMTFPAESAILGIPSGISFEQAAASAEGAHYAYNFINKVKLNAGQKVLVNGATGAIGSSAVQFLKHYGIYVTAVCDTEHMDLVTSMGADKVIDYTQEDFTHDEDRYEFVFDAVGKSTFFKCKRLLKNGGTYISSELGPNAQNPFLALMTPITGGKQVKFPLPVNIKASLTFISDLLEKGKFKPLIDKEYPMERIAEAYEYVNSGQKIGNVIIRIGEE